MRRKSGEPVEVMAARWWGTDYWGLTVINDSLNSECMCALVSYGVARDHASSCVRVIHTRTHVLQLRVLHFALAKLHNRLALRYTSESRMQTWKSEILTQCAVGDACVYMYVLTCWVNNNSRWWINRCCLPQLKCDLYRKLFAWDYKRKELDFLYSTSDEKFWI